MKKFIIALLLLLLFVLFNVILVNISTSDLTKAAQIAEGVYQRHNELMNVDISLGEVMWVVGRGPEKDHIRFPKGGVK